MSRSVATLVYSKKTGSAMRKAILAYMADRANDDGSGIWCSKQRIADEIEASRSSVISNIREMVADGILVEVGKRQHQNGYTMEYAINISAVLELPDAQQEDPFKFVRVQQPDVTRPGAGHQDVRELDINRPTTVLEPSNMSDGLEKAVQDIWEITPEPSRKRSSRKELLAAIRGLKGRVSFDDLILALRDCISDPQMIRDGHKYLPAIHRWIRDGRYEAFLPKTPDLLSSAGEEKTTEASLLDSAFAFYAKHGRWKGRLDGFLYEPDEPEADYPAELYAKYGLTKPGRAA